MQRDCLWSLLLAVAALANGNWLGHRSLGWGYARIGLSRLHASAKNTKTEDVDAYFQGIKTNVPRKITIGEYSTLVLSDTAVVFAGFDVFGMTKEGQAIETPARFTFVITKGDQGWRISHFHSSLRPNPQ